MVDCSTLENPQNLWVFYVEEDGLQMVAAVAYRSQGGAWAMETGLSEPDSAGIREALGCQKPGDWNRVLLLSIDQAEMYDELDPTLIASPDRDGDDLMSRFDCAPFDWLEEHLSLLCVYQQTGHAECDEIAGYGIAELLDMDSRTVALGEGALSGLDLAFEQEEDSFLIYAGEA